MGTTWKGCHSVNVMWVLREQREILGGTIRINCIVLNVDVENSKEMSYITVEISNIAYHNMRISVRTGLVKWVAIP